MYESRTRNVIQPKKGVVVVVGGGVYCAICRPILTRLMLLELTPSAVAWQAFTVFPVRVWKATDIAFLTF